jgi:phenylacetate-coenzyme A ligase PaaK-like adenylate-forming protein
MIGAKDVLSAAWTVSRHAHATRDVIVAYQDWHLRRLIDHAYRNVPYYRALFDRHGVAPGRIRTVTDLSCVPITTKRDLQETPARDVVASGLDPDRLLVHTTSGSSGEPLSIRRAWLEERLGTAFRMRALRDFGLRPTDRRVDISLVRPHDARDWDLPQRILRAFGIYRKASVDCRSAPEEILRRLEELRPDVIAAFPGVVCRIARVVTGGRPTTLRPRFFISGGEVLTPLMRREITEAFGAPIVEHYGTHELGTVAWQCMKKGGFHVTDDGVIVEVLKDGRPARPGEVGEIVATRLHAFAMPFIRYRLGDLVTLGDAPCACGAPFSTIFTVQGRMLDYFPLANGRLLHPYELVMIILDHGKRWIGQYQLTQERRDRVVLRVVPRMSPSAEDIASFERAAQEHLGPGVEFQVVLVPDVALEWNGKFRVSRSLVESSYDGIDWDRLRATDFPAFSPERVTDTSV